jgi:acetyltransferase-like isoleucine patch superfamily enzyme
VKKYYRILRFSWPLHFVLLITNWFPDNVFFLGLRGFLASFFFKQCGRNLKVGRNVSFYNPGNIQIGDDVYIAYGCWFLGAEDISIESQVMFGPYCVIADANHTMLNGSYRFGEPKIGFIKIREGSWIGAHSIVLMNVSIGKGVLVAANSVVNRDVEELQVVGGAPCRILKKNRAVSLATGSVAND